MVQNMIQIKSEITVNMDVRIENIIYVKKIVFGILLHVVVKMVNIVDDLVVRFDEIVDREAKLYNRETKQGNKNYSIKF